jgi:hypothetical protein
VVIGLRDRDRAQIVSGLEPDERVLVPSATAGNAQQQRRGMGLFGGPRR